MGSKRTPVGTAETVARFSQVHGNLDQKIGELQQQMDGLRQEMHTGFDQLTQALTDQSNSQLKAVDTLLELVGQDSDATSLALADHEERLRRLEEGRPPAA